MLPAAVADQLAGATAIMNTFNANDLSTIPRARKLAEKVFGEGWEALGHKIYKGDPADAQTWGIGNCHIDTVGLSCASEQSVAYLP